MKTLPKAIFLLCLALLLNISCERTNEKTQTTNKKANIIASNDSIARSEWLQIEKGDVGYYFPCSEWKRKIVVNTNKILLDLTEPTEWEVSKIEKNDAGYNIFIKTVEWFYRFTWIDKPKGIAKWEFIEKGVVNKDFSYFAVKNSPEALQAISQIDCDKIKALNNNFSLDGTWAYDEDFTFATMSIEKNTGFLIVMSSQIYIYISINKNKTANNSYNVFYERPADDLGPGGVGMDWVNYSKTKPIATIKRIENGNIEFYWTGFYNNKTESIEFEKCEFNDQSNSNPVMLVRKRE